MASTSSPMPSMSAAATPSFDLPAMPGPYEDFEFSLNLPENITASDLNFVASPDFSHFFGLSNAASNSLSAPSTEMTPVNSAAPPFGGSSDLPSSSAAPPLSGSTPATPKGRESDDTIMAHGSAAMADGDNTTQNVGFNTKAEAVTTSVPLPASMASAPPSAPYHVPQSLQGYAGTSGGNDFAMYQTLMQQSQSVQQSQAQLQMQQANMGLFDANETSFLTNFLSGFEGWDFNPNLPMDLPSFADAEKLAFQYGAPQALSPSSGRAASRQRSGAAMRNAKGSPHASFNGYGQGNGGAMYGQQDPSASMMMMMQQEQQQQQSGGWPAPMQDGQSSESKKKIKTGHGRSSDTPTRSGRNVEEAEPDKRSNHILSEQRRRNHIREAFKELVDMLEAGRDFGARGLGLSSGAGTGIEDEGLDDRSDHESTLEDEEPSAATKRRKLKARKRAALEAARKAGARDPAAAAALLNGGVGRGKGRGRGGSAGGGAGSKSAVLFQAVDLLQWLNGRNAVLTGHVQQLEEAVAQAA